MQTVKRAGAAQRMRPLMAFDRKTFRDKLLDILGGAITHYYMVKLAELNNQSKWVHHWNTEVDRLIHMDTVRILVTPIGNPACTGIRVTPNVYTTLEEIDTFSEAMEKIIRQGLPVSKA